MLVLAAVSIALFACRRPDGAGGAGADAAQTMPGIVGALRATNAAGRSGAYLLVPTRDPRPLMVFMHGTGGAGAQGVEMFRALAERRRFHVLAPDSRISPQGAATWEVGDRVGEVTPDYQHVIICIEELLAMPGVAVDRQRVLAIGYSGGASMAPYLATNDDAFGAFAILHGGVFPGGLGGRPARGWMSTGEADTLRTPSATEQHAAALRAAGYEVESRVFPGGHATTAAELEAVVTWWLGP